MDGPTTIPGKDQDFQVCIGRAGQSRIGQGRQSRSGYDRTDRTGAAFLAEHRGLSYGATQGYAHIINSVNINGSPLVAYSG